MNKKGFSLIELLASLAVLGIILAIGINASNGAMATSLSRLRVVEDNEVFTAAKNYVIENNISFNNHGYICIDVDDLIKYGYLNDTNDSNVKNQKVALYGNNLTKVINKIKYVERCD